jgi:hypothetical protein
MFPTLIIELHSANFFAKLEVKSLAVFISRFGGLVVITSSQQANPFCWFPMSLVVLFDVRTLPLGLVTIGLD